MIKKVFMMNSYESLLLSAIIGAIIFFLSIGVFCVRQVTKI